MKAVWYERTAPPMRCCIWRHGRPEPAAGEVLVRLHASGVNPSDVKARAGSRPMGFTA